MRPRIDILPGNSNSIAAEPRSCGGGARNRSRLAVLHSKNPIRIPATQEGVHHPVVVIQKLSSLADGQFITPAQVNYLLNVKITKSKILVDTPESRQVRRPEPGQSSRIQDVDCIRNAPGPSEVRENA